MTAEAEQEEARGALIAAALNWDVLRLKSARNSRDWGKSFNVAKLDLAGAVARYHRVMGTEPES